MSERTEAFRITLEYIEYADPAPPDIKLTVRQPGINANTQSAQGCDATVDLPHGRLRLRAGTLKPQRGSE